MLGMKYYIVFLMLGISVSPAFSQVTEPPRNIAEYDKNGIDNNTDEQINTVSDYIKNADTLREYNAISNALKKQNKITGQKYKRGDKPIYLQGVHSTPKPFPIKMENNEYRSVSDKMEILIPNSPSQKIKILEINKATGSEPLGNFEVSLPNINSNQQLSRSNTNGLTKKPQLATDNTLVYLDYEKDTDVAIQSFGDSIRILTVLNSTNSPSEYSYEISIPLGGRLEKDDESGGVMIFDNQDNFLGGFSPPWAIDSKGEKVETSYEISDNTLVQVVNHTNGNFSYPIIADPLFGLNLISSWSWHRRAQYGFYGWRLEVIPTLWARSWGGSYVVGTYGWDELQYGWVNAGGMRDQFICHQQFAFTKSVWGLDVWRPDVSYAATVAYLCNP